MDARLIKEFEGKELTQFHKDLLSTCNEKLKASRARMAEKYTSWDRQHEVYMSRRPLDTADRKAIDQGIPAKFIVPLTFAQIQTFVAFCFLLFKQNPRFFELEGTGAEDHEIQDIMELAIEGDLQSNRWSLVLYQFLVDASKFGLGAIKTAWRTEKRDYMASAPTQMPSGGTPMQSTLQTATCFEGNRLYNISPYKFFPDHRLPVRDFQRGEYCASMEEYVRSELEGMAVDGFLAGLEHVGKMNSRNDFGIERMRFAWINLKDPQDDSVCIMDMQIKLIPSKYKLKDGSKLGESNRPTTYVIWVANDERIIRMEPLDAYHCEFTYVAHELLPDIQEKLNLGLAELIDVLQEVVGWFINSRVTSVSRTIDNWLVVDPSGIDMNSVETRSRVILMKKAAARLGVDRFIQQLNVQDNTAKHIEDAQLLMQLLQTVTGVNENAMGQYNSGRRSATEARAVISGASARMKMLAELIWTGALAPLGRQMMINLRQALSPEMFQQRMGITRMEAFPLFHANPKDLIQNSDFFVFNGTMPSEKSFVAQSLQELLAIILQNPQAALQFNLDPNKLIKEIYELRGIPGLIRFGYTPEEQAKLLAASQAAAGGVPGDESAQPVSGGPPAAAA